MSALLTEFRLCLACLFCGWAFDLTPPTDKATRLALHNALQAMLDDDKANRPRGVA
ncbi:hypothetical protein [Mesorhizobium sp. M2A.F.Ca.ET.015.02.1.1]|uniref:hypothetical protein n=1 Tax=Mesorhizobium sp. M2A.F.Ca.ET.015.02.1.1 TaxID=2496758 RepID=UPI00167E525F|nr:hypothetical protein [Mesorhizobium sp. M2A.F.Ca.ET.015.02.1.1]